MAETTETIPSLGLSGQCIVPKQGELFKNKSDALHWLNSRYWGSIWVKGDPHKQQGSAIATVRDYIDDGLYNRIDEATCYGLLLAGEWREVDKEEAELLCRRLSVAEMGKRPDAWEQVMAAFLNYACDQEKVKFTANFSSPDLDGEPPPMPCVGCCDNTNVVLFFENT
eukprot:TRINITY_DN60963_c0_g1_i1.p1 TRINITY_DN60963_c0_g1~~TRINITY_DN60963_c0_g1_i1.p1  ORF type:complete len:168 (-),score=13.21 TRINITY_DN60963_c0_g1_i1:613-1116(-)